MYVSPKRGIIILFSFVLFCFLVSIAQAATVNYVILDKNISKSGTTIALDSAITLSGGTAISCNSYLSSDSSYNPEDTVLGVLSADSCDGSFIAPSTSDGDYFILARLTYQNTIDQTETATNSTPIKIDNTPPSFVNLLNRTIKNNESLDYNISTEDANGISNITVNNTNTFNITSSKHLDNITGLSIGTYRLTLTVTDLANNPKSEEIKVTVVESKPATITFVILDKSIAKSGTTINVGTAVNLNNHTAVSCYSYLSTDNSYSSNDTLLGTLSTDSCDGSFVIPSIGDGNYFVLSRLTYQDESSPAETVTNFASITIDTTRPVFTNLTDKTVRDNESLDYNISTYDTNEISNITVNNTNTFNITSSKHLVNITGLNIGRYKLNLSLTDAAGNANSAVITVTVIGNNQVYADKKNMTLSNETTEITVDSGSPVEKITIPKEVSSDTEINLSLVSLLDGGNVTLVNNFTLIRETSSYNYTAVIPSGTVVIGGSEWNGKINLPISKPNSSYTAPSGSVDKPIEIGSGIELNFSDPVKVVLGGMAGKKAGWSRGSGSLRDIPTICNNATNPTNIDHKITKECYINSGEDLVIHSYHFTTFAAYTPSEPASSGSSGSGTSHGGSNNRVISKEPIVEEEAEIPVIEPIKETQEEAPAPVVQNTQPPHQEEKGFFNSLTGAVTGVGTKEIIGSIIALAIVVTGISGYMFIKKRRKV